MSLTAEQLDIHWLVRKNGVSILGPYLTTQVRSMIEQGMLEARDEVCPENSYWFCIHEVKEVEAKLGISPDKLKDILVNSDGEETQSDVTLELEEDTAPDLQNPENASATSVLKLPRSQPVTKIALEKKPAQASAQDVADRFQRVGNKGIALQRRQEGWNLEKGRFWGLVIVASIIMAGFGILWVIRTLRA